MATWCCENCYANALDRSLGAKGCIWSRCSCHKTAEPRNMPEWARTPHKACDPLCASCKMSLAISIAWEALGRIVIGRDDKPSGMSTPPVDYSRDNLRKKAIDALSRIENLGSTGGGE